MDYVNLSMPDITVDYSYIYWIIVAIIVIVLIIFVVAFAGLTSSSCKDTDLIVTNVNAQNNNTGSYYIDWRHVSSRPIAGFKVNLYNANGNKVNTLDVPATDTYVTVPANGNRYVGVQAYKLSTSKTGIPCIGKEVRITLPQ